MNQLRLVIKSLSVALACCALATGQARADDLADEADLHFQLGAERYRARDYRGALQHFLTSNRLVPNRNVVFNIARTFEQLRKFSDAYRYYHQALDAEAAPAARAPIEEAIARIAPEVAVLRVITEPPGATIYIDRRDLGSRGDAPRDLAFSPGVHKVIAELAGHEPAEVGNVELVRGEQRVVELRLERIVGTVRVEGVPPTALVRLGNPEAAPSCTGPCELLLPPGRHSLYVEDARHELAMQEVEVVARAVATVRPVLRALRGSLVVHTDEREALIEVDGRPVGFAPAVLDVEVGERRVRVSRNGFAPVERTVTIRAKQETRIEAELRLIEEVTAASRVTEAVEDAPSSVSIISSQELRAMGYPTIAEAVRGIRGVYVSDDRAYKTIGIRGLALPGNYGNRVLVLLDGHPTNDNWIGSSFMDFDARTDLEDVERIEVVRGPGSVLYGTNAFSGVINIVTRGRKQPTGGSVGVSTVEYGVARGRAMANVQLGKDAGFWASVAAARGEGRTFTFPEYVEPPDSDGVARGLDSFEAGTVSGSAWWGPVSLMGFLHSRDKHVPTATFDTLFGDPRLHQVDTRGLIEARVEPSLGREAQVMVRAFVDYYRFRGYYPYAEADGGLGLERFRGTWAGGEGRLMVNPFRALRITVGGEGQRHFQVDQFGTNEQEVYLNRADPYTVAAGYLLADVKPSERLRLSAGTRVDWYSTFGSSVNPRAALIIRPYDNGNLKVLAGKAFRAPSIYELYYNDGGRTQVASPDLKPETIYSPELEFSHQFSSTWSGLVAGYGNYVQDLIVARGEGTDLSPTYYQNSPSALLTTGGEVTIRREWRRGWMLSLSYAYQHSQYLQSEEAGAVRLRNVPNAPEHMGSLRGAAPIIPTTLVAATRLSVEGPRYDRYDRDGDPAQQQTDAVAVWDFVVSGQVPQLGLRYAAGVYNAFDWRYSVPVSTELRQRTIVQNGRTLLLSSALDF